MRFTQTSIDASRNSVMKLFTKYRHTICPCPFKFEDFYWFAWERNEQEALKLLEPKGAINSGRSLLIKCKSLKGKRDWLKDDGVGFSYPGGYGSWPYPSVEITDEAITNTVLRDQFLRWVVKAKQLRFLQSRCEKYIKQVISYQWDPATQPGPLNTAGQLYRVWPELACMVEKKYRDRVAEQKLKSALPKLWTDEYLEEIQNRPYIQEINTHLLAMSLMEDDVREDQHYPNV